MQNNDSILLAAQIQNHRKLILRNISDEFYQDLLALSQEMNEYYRANNEAIQNLNMETKK